MTAIGQYLGGVDGRVAYIIRRVESILLADGSLWLRETLWHTWVGGPAPRPYAGPDDDLPIPLSLGQRRYIPRNPTPAGPKPQPSRASRYQRDWGGHDSIHDYRVESRRNTALRRGATTAADFLGDD